MVNEKLSCAHCGDICPDDTIQSDGRMFCCTGCQSVYLILKDHNMGQFYSLDDNAGVRPVSRSKHTYKYLENEELANELLDFKEGESSRITILLPQIHCASCVWLLENIHKLNKGIISSEVNFVNKRASIHFKHQEISLKELAELLDRIGYAPKFDSPEKHSSKVKRDLVLKLAVAGFCFGNIMLLSFPEYLNPDEDFAGKYRSIFSYIILGLSLPVLLYSASDYLKSAYKAIKAKAINLDVPISIGIAVLYGRSVYDIFVGNGPGYMDSFAGFVFFLLIGKWFQQKTYDYLSFDRDYTSYFPMAVSRLKENGDEEVVKIGSIKQGDLIRIHNEEVIPADAELLSGDAHINYSFVTGESELIHKHKGDLLFAGGRLHGESVELRIKKKVNQSYLTQLWESAGEKEIQKGSLQELTDSLGRRFTLIVIIIAILAGAIWFFIEPSNVVNIITSVLIVACPCALALSVPFTFGNAQRLLGRKGIYFKNADAIEQLARIDTIVFDKTGTLSESDGYRIRFVGEELTNGVKEAITSLVANSNHPLSKALSAHFKVSKFHNKTVSGFREHVGKGLSGNYDGKHLLIGSPEFVGALPVDNLTSVFISLDGEILGHYVFESTFRPGLENMFNSLHSAFDVHVLSGDSEKDKLAISDQYNIANMAFKQSPQDKLKYIENLQKQGKRVLMLGDGLNDAGALMKSDVGISVAEDIYNFSPACDAIVEANKLHSLFRYISISKYAVRLLKYSYIFSLIYNLTGLGFAVFNLLNPLVAAIIMPLSSISVVALTYLGTVWYERRVYKGD